MGSGFPAQKAAPAAQPDQSDSCSSCADEPTAGVRWETLELRPDQIPADPGWRHKAAFTEPLPSVRTCSARPSSLEPADPQTPRRENPGSLFQSSLVNLNFTTSF